MPPPRKRQDYHQQRTLRQQRQQQRQQNLNNSQGQQQSPDQQQQQDKQSNGSIGAVDSNNAQAQDQVPASLAAKFVQLVDTQGDNSLVVSNDIRDAVQKDIQEILEGDLYCAICREIYIDPVILNCAHSFCRFCLNNWLSKQVGCPSCRTVVVFQTENLALKNVINKMILTSSHNFQKERKLTLEQRSRTELAQNNEGKVKPIMEKKSFLPDGRVKGRGRTIQSWRGPNGATIWRTQIGADGQVIRPDLSNPNNQDSSSDDDDEDEDVEVEDEDSDEDGDDEFDDDDYVYETDYEDYDHFNITNGDSDDDDDEDLYEPPESEIQRADNNSEDSDDDSEDSDDTDDEEIDDDPEFDESGQSAIEIDSDDSYVESRRRQMDDLSILAGHAPADSDEDYEVEIGADSDADSSDSTSDETSMDESTVAESHDESMFEAYNIYASRAQVDEMDTESEDDAERPGVEISEIISDTTDSSDTDSSS